MKRIKRLLVGILAVVMMFSLFGCNKETEVTPSNGETIKPSVNPDIFIDETRKEDLSDFQVEMELVDNEEVTSYCLKLDEETEYSEYYLLNFNHREDMFEVNFYDIAMEKIEVNDFSYAARDFKCKIPTEMLQYNCYIQYSVPEVIPNCIMSFVSKGGTNMDYLITYNGRDGGVTLVPITEEMMKTNDEEPTKIELNNIDTEKKNDN